jgi:hypothetical protein
LRLQVDTHASSLGPLATWLQAVGTRSDEQAVSRFAVCC